jgi:hypothetical protein
MNASLYKDKWYKIRIMRPLLTVNGKARGHKAEYSILS